MRQQPGVVQRRQNWEFHALGKDFEPKLRELCSVAPKTGSQAFCTNSACAHGAHSAHTVAISSCMCLSAGVSRDQVGRDSRSPWGILVIKMEAPVLGGSRPPQSAPVCSCPFLTSRNTADHTDLSVLDTPCDQLPTIWGISTYMSFCIYVVSYHGA